MQLRNDVYKKMGMFEKFRLYVLRRRYVTWLRRLDKAIVTGKRDRACKCEDKMYDSDNRLEDFIHVMTMKYG